MPSLPFDGPLHDHVRIWDGVGHRGDVTSRYATTTGSMDRAKAAMIPCPNCNLTGYHHVVWGPRSLIAVGFNVVCVLVQFVFLAWTE